MCKAKKNQFFQISILSMIDDGIFLAHMHTNFSMIKQEQYVNMAWKRETDYLSYFLYFY